MRESPTSVPQRAIVPVMTGCQERWDVVTCLLQWQSTAHITRWAKTLLACLLQLSCSTADLKLISP